MRGVWGKVCRWVGNSKCLLLTVCVVIFMLGSALFAENRMAGGVLMLLFFIAMIFAPYFISGSRKILLLTLIGGGVLLLPKGMISFEREILTFSTGGTTVSHVAMIGLIFFEALLVICVTYQSLRGRSGAEPICGCVLTFLLLGIGFGDTFFLLSRLFDGAFVYNGAPFMPTLPDMHYFSFTTLTTTGYGDIVAAHPFLRQVVSLENTCGVLYVALFVGKLINMRSHPPAKEPENDPGAEAKTLKSSGDAGKMPPDTAK